MPDALYEILYEPHAERDLDKVPANDFRRLDAKICALAENPRPVGVEKLTVTTYRIRSGDWRVIYLIDDGAKRIVISRIRRRNERTYRNL